MTKQMRVNFFGDAATFGSFFDNLLNSAGREFRMTIELKNISGFSRADMSFQFLSKFRQNRHITAFTAFAFLDQNQLFVKIEIFDFDGNEFGNSGSSQKKRFKQQSVGTVFPVGLSDEFLFFITRKTVNHIYA